MEVDPCLEAKGAGPYTYAVTTIWINRVIVALSAAGIAIAGSLSYFVFENLLIPCSGKLGCQFVQMHKSSHVGDVPVAYIGLAGFVLLFGIAVARTLVSGGTYRILTTVGAMGAFSGLAFSGYLMYMSFAVIAQTCVWCVSSFATILLIALLHAALFQFGPAKERDLPVGSMLATGALMLSIGFIGWKMQGEKRSADIFLAMIATEGVTLERALPDASKVRGDANDKITLLEFADMNCPMCRQLHPVVDKIIKKGGVRFAYRHFPVSHATSSRAALISEYAATQGKFWEYLEIVFAPENTLRARSEAGQLAMAGEIGLDTAELKKIFAGEGGEELFESLLDDEELREEMKITMTPTFILFAEGVKPKAIHLNTLEQTLNSKPYKALLEAGR